MRTFGVSRVVGRRQHWVGSVSGGERTCPILLAPLCEPTNCSSSSTINSAPLRAGQTQPTRVVRLLAEDTVDACLLDVQRRKLESGEVAVAGSEGPTLAEADAGMLLSVYEAIK